MNITFGAFENLVRQMDEQSTKNLAIRLDGGTGRLGTYSVSIQKLDRNEQQTFTDVKNSLTKALSNELGVKSTDLPKQITDILTDITKRGHLMAGDITNLSNALNNLASGRNNAISKFCETQTRLNDDIGRLLTGCGCGKTVTLPAKAPLTKALERAFDATLEDMMSITDVEELGKRTTEMADKLEGDLRAIVEDAFGKDGTSGPLAMRLLSIQDSAESPERTKALEREMMDFQTVEMLAGNEDPKLDPESTKTSDRAVMAKYQLNVFNKRISALLGDTCRGAGDHVSTGIPFGSQIAKAIDAVLKDPRYKTVGAIRKTLQELMDQVLGTAEKPSALATDLFTIGHDGARNSQLGTKRLLARKALMRVQLHQEDDPEKLAAQEHRAVVSVCRLALSDFKVNKMRASQHAPEPVDDDDDFIFDDDEVVDPSDLLTADPDTARQINWILTERGDVNNLADLKRLEDFILSGDTEGIKLLDKQLGDPHVSDADIEQAFNDVISDHLWEMIGERSPLVDDPNFELYFKQCTGELPRDMVNGEEVYRVGQWAANPDYRAELARIVPYVKSRRPTQGCFPTLDHPLLSKDGQRLKAESKYQKSVDDFRRAFDLKNDNSFKTIPLKTKGQLYFDPKTGALKSANRHFGSTVPSTPDENFRLRLSLVDAFRQGGAPEAFLQKARETLGLGSDSQTTPVSRQVVKALIIEFDRPNSRVSPKVEQQTKPSPHTPTFVGRNNDQDFGGEWDSSMSKFYSTLKNQPKTEQKEPEPSQQETKIETEQKEPEPSQQETKIETEQKEPEPSQQESKIETEQQIETATVPPKGESIVNEPQNRIHQKQDEQNPSRVFTAPKDVDVDHPVNYDNLWQHPAGVIRRRLLFLTPEKVKSLSNYIPPDLLNADNAPSKWLTSIMSVTHFKNTFIKELKEQIESLPSVSGNRIDSKLLTNYLNDAVRQAANLPADRKTDQALTGIASSLASKIFSSSNSNPSPQQVGMMKHALVAGMGSFFLGLGSLTLFSNYNIINQGGGLVRADRWSLRENGRDLSSSILPRTDVETTFKVKNERKLHLTGLSRSELADEGGTGKMTFLRFGEVVMTANSRQPGLAQELLQELAEQTFLNNDALVANAKDGDTINLPIVRMDLSGHESIQGNGESFKLTFTPKGATQPITVTINPKVEHFCLSTDEVKARPEKTLLFTKDEMEKTHSAWTSLKARANQYLKENKPNSQNVRLLLNQIDDYFKTVLKKGNELEAFPNFGAELTRLGARIGVLASLLGDVPSANCHWGRDRTGVMDNEFKLTWLTLTSDPKQLPPIRLKSGQTDPLREQRTRMLDATGNRQIAHQVNCTTYDINLHQETKSFTFKKKEYQGSGLDTLFDVGKLPAFSQRVQDIDKESVSLHDEQGHPRTPAQICDLLLPNVHHEIAENAGNGHCFFYSALQQMTEVEKGQNGTVDRFRQAFADNLKQKADAMNRPQNPLKGLYKEGGVIMVHTSTGGQVLSDAFRPLTEYPDDFRNGNAMADVSHGAFLADMLKRPVTIISANSLDSGATKITFDCDLTTGQPFANQDPIIIYYEQFQNDGIRQDSGHFRAVLPQ